MTGSGTHFALLVFGAVSGTLCVSPLIARPIQLLGLGSPQTGMTMDASALSGDGRTVVGIAHNPDALGATRWSAPTGASWLDPAVGSTQYFVPRGVSHDGTIVAGIYDHDGTEEPFIWSASTGFEPLGQIRPAKYSSSRGLALSADGTTVVGEGIALDFAQVGSMEPIVWTRSTGMVSLGAIPGAAAGGAASGVSGDGRVIVGMTRSTTRWSEAFRWTAATGMVGLGTLSADDVSSEATAISADGSVIAGISRAASSSRAFRWTASGGISELSPLSGDYHELRPERVSADGSIISGVAMFDGFNRAVLWDRDGAAHFLDEWLADIGAQGLDGWNLQWVSGISADGNTITGTGISPSGEPESWIVTVPAPGSGALMLATLAFERRRRARITRE